MKCVLVQNCCEECSFGRLTGESLGKEACGAAGEEDVSLSSILRREAFRKCCLKAANAVTTTVATTPETTTETSADPCKSDPCEQICQSENGEARCLCKAGFRLGQDETSCIDINECADSDANLCTDDSMVCHNTPGSYKCVPLKKRETRLSCPPGFKMNLQNKVCDDINECQLPRPPCPKYLCQNTIGAYKCAGKLGKPAAVEAPDAPAPPAGTTTTPAPRDDMCPPGFRAGPDDECVDIDECGEQSDDCQRLSQHCINTHGSFFCQDHVSKRCAPGFKVNSATGICEDIDECEESGELCKRNEVCVNLPGAYNCKSKISTLPRLASKKCQEGTRLRPGGTICEVPISSSKTSTNVARAHTFAISSKTASTLLAATSAAVRTASNWIPILALVQLTYQFYCRLCAAAVSLLLGRIGRWSERETDASQAERLGRSYLSIACSTLSLARSAQTERDNESCFFVRAAGVHRFIRRYHVKNKCIHPQYRQNIDECSMKLDTCAPGTHCLNVLGSYTCTREPVTAGNNLGPYEYEEYSDYGEEYNNDTSVTPVEPPTTPKPPPTTTVRRTSARRYPSTTPRIAAPTTSTRRPTTVTRPTTTNRPTTINKLITTTTTSIPTTSKPTTTSRPTTTSKPTTTSSPTTTSKPTTTSRPTTITKPPTASRPPTTNRLSTTSRSTTSRPRRPHRPETPANRPNTERPLNGTTDRRYQPPITNRPATTRTDSRPNYPPFVTNPESNTETTTDKESAVTETDKFNPNFLYCLDGFERDENNNCVDIDECRRNKYLCGSSEICKNFAGGYVCECAPGYQRDETGWCVPIATRTTPTTTSTTTMVATSSTTSTTTPAPRTPSPTTSVTYPDWNYSPPTPSRAHDIPPLLCELGYRLDVARQTCVDIDECASGRANCGADERCINVPGGYRCVCSKQRCLPASESYTPSYVIPPSTGNVQANVITVGSQYGQRGPKYLRPSYARVRNGAVMASCPWGYKLHEQRCQDIDECTTDSPVCGPDQRCENFNGGYSCQCPAGHRLDGDLCVDVNECEIAQPCSMNGQCINTVGSYRCECGHGFRNAPANDKVCVDIDECAERPGICQQGCINAWGGYRCTCTKGYRLHSDNRTCADIDECAEWSSRRGRLCVDRCVNVEGSFRCECPYGYRLSEDGRSCVDIDECEIGIAGCASGDPAVVCQNTRGSYHCHKITCPQGYRLEHKHRCVRIQRSCPYSDWQCMRRPGTYSYNFITFVSNLYLPSGSVDLFTMHGPSWSDSITHFELGLVGVQAPAQVTPADISCFEVRSSGSSCAVSLRCSLQGPQVAELELTMTLHRREQYAGSAVAKLVLIVSKYEF
ncbi:EGF-containing fibulin-like extracellular matrix protein 1 [Eumeta japonica]|uniref:EGF-containing fibulin-like extracellular matrix protein 1 n=1 Tax=Eumeta variegata TaxID=151549 RepID=A0A4C1TFT4_EUMVA|nr:EGF-containing fibulin-like extracellular matrix protein 1 [Eumeta japonica]